MDIIVTNNPLVEKQYRELFHIEYQDSASGVYIRVRDLVHGGHILLTHPLSGGLKPGEAAYRSVLVSGKIGGVDEQSLRMIEDCISLSRGFTPVTIPDRNLPDLQSIDLSLISSALEK